MAVAGVVCFSLRPILIKLAYGYVVDPITLLALRMVFSLPFFLAAAVWVGRDQKRAPISRKDAWAVVCLGFLGYYFAGFVDFLGLQCISAGLGRLILFIYPTLVVLLSMAFLRKRPTAREVVALGATYAGIALVMSNAMEGSGAHFALGVALCFASAAGYAVYLVASSQVVQRVGSMRFTAYAMSVASAFCILQFLLLRPISALRMPGEVYGLAVAMALASTVLPVFITTEALKRIGATGATGVTVAADITGEQGRISALAACPEPDILITNAGGPPPGDFRKFSREDWLKAVGANMITPIELIRATVDGMISRRFGRIVNITSSAVKAPIAELALSNGARSGLTGFVAGLAL